MNNKLIYIILILVLQINLQAQLVKTYFKTGELKAKTNYIDGTHTKLKEGIKNGIQEVYYLNGVMAFKINFINNKRDGKLTWYDKQNKKLSETFYKDGKLNGIEKFYFVSNKKVKHEVNYINDKKEGIQKEYFKNGVVALKVNYKNNKKEGMQEEYTIDNKLFTKVNYINNYKEGYQYWYDKQGNIINKIFYKMDRPIEVMKKIQAKKDDKILINSIDFSPQKAK